MFLFFSLVCVVLEQKTSMSNHWYHQSCIAHMYEEMGKELPEQHYEWARNTIQSFKDKSDEEKEDVYLYEMVVAFGIHYGIRRLLERAYIAFPENFSCERIELIARKLALTNAIDRYNRETTSLRICMGYGMGRRYKYGEYYIHVNHPFTWNEMNHQQVNAHFVFYDKDAQNIKN